MPIADAVELTGPKELVRIVKNIPSGPRILPRLQKLLGDPNSSLEEIIVPIRLDQGIAARVLHVGNSAYYSKGVRCQTVEESINRIGFRQVYSVVSNALCSESLVRPLKSYGLKPEEVWKISVAGGLAAEYLAVQSGQDRNTAYTIGLLHGLGMVVIDNWLQRSRPLVRLTYRDFAREYGEDELAQLKFTQAEAAAALLESWEFPEAMVAPIRLQYSPQVPAEHARMVALLRVAKWLRTVVCGIWPLPPEIVDPAALQLLRLSQSQVSMMIEHLREQMQESRELLATS